MTRSRSKTPARWLKPKERLAVLNDRALIAMLARLPERSEPIAEPDAEARRPADQTL